MYHNPAPIELWELIAEGPRLESAPRRSWNRVPTGWIPSAAWAPGGGKAVQNCPFWRRHRVERSALGGNQRHLRDSPADQRKNPPRLNGGFGACGAKCAVSQNEPSTPVVQGDEYRQQAATIIGELILEPGRPFCVLPSLEDTVSDEIVQALCEDLAAQPQLVSQLIEL